ncbi:MAG: ComEC/Rec2 family competence protein [Candidatus Omnitrophica bacterium]|nr:ComEC/Rec2 family competence protein [Candidatus Omnitrophota bacterium]
MPLDSGAFLRAILLGDRSELPRAVQAAFKNSGTMHILAISGLHVGIIASVIIYLLKFLRLGRNPAYIFTILFLIIFSLLTLSRPSVVRATVMACVFLIGMLLGRRVDVYNSLGAASLFILLKNPKDLFSVGFQLSFLAVLSIICFAPRFMRLARQDTNFYIKRYLYTPLAVSISAWLGTFPLILYYFRIITPVAIVANIFIIPALFALLVGGMGFILLGWIGFAGTILAGLNNLCANTIFFLAEFFSSLKFGHFHL